MDLKSSTSLRSKQPQPNGRNGAPKGQGAARRVGRPRQLPSGRAVLGGVLVAASLVAAVTLSRAAGVPPTVPTVVASTNIEPWDMLGPHNLTVIDLALPDSLVDHTYPSADALAGTVSRTHLREGEVLQRGGVIESTAGQRAAAPAREVSLRIDNDRAVDGRLEAGDRVDVLATYGNGIDAVTFVVLADVQVLSAARVEGGVSSGRALVLTLALSDRADTIALAHAVDNADITVVRTTTAELTSASEPDLDRTPFSPDPDASQPGSDDQADDAEAD